MRGASAVTVFCRATNVTAMGQVRVFDIAQSLRSLTSPRERPRYYRRLPVFLGPSDMKWCRRRPSSQLEWKVARTAGHRSGPTHLDVSMFLPVDISVADCVQNQVSQTAHMLFRHPHIVVACVTFCRIAAECGCRWRSPSLARTSIARIIVGQQHHHADRTHGYSQ